MKTKNFVLSGILGIALSGFVLTGCHKSSTTPDTDYAAAQDEANASFASNDSKNVSDAAMQGSSNKYGPAHTIQSAYSSSCVLSWDSTTIAGNITVTIDFGSAPVQCKDYRWREGKIQVSWKASSGFFLQAYFDSATAITETFNGYKVGTTQTTMYGVAGTRTWTNEGHNVNGFENWNFTADLTITNPSGKKATWKSTRNNVLTYVGTTWYYVITGSASGTSSSGVGYSLTITSPLYVTAYPWWYTPAPGCPWIEAGVVSISRDGFSNTLTINFGNVGTCDSQAIATLNGNNYTIYMW